MHSETDADLARPAQQFEAYLVVAAAAAAAEVVAAAAAVSAGVAAEAQDL